MRADEPLLRERVGRGLDRLGRRYRIGDRSRSTAQRIATEGIATLDRRNITVERRFQRVRTAAAGGDCGQRDRTVSYTHLPSPRDS